MDSESILFAQTFSQADHLRLMQEKISLQKITTDYRITIPRKWQINKTNVSLNEISHLICIPDSTRDQQLFLICIAGSVLDQQELSNENRTMLHQNITICLRLFVQLTQLTVAWNMVKSAKQYGTSHHSLNNYYNSSFSTLRISFILLRHLVSTNWNNFSNLGAVL